MKSLIVEKDYNNKKLIEYLLSKFDGLSISTIYKTLRNKDIKINNKRISENCILHIGDEIKVYVPDELFEKKINIPIVYQDENIVVFNKPKNIEVTGENSLTTYAKKMFKNDKNNFVEPCHRLDRNTCGITLFARNEEALKILLDAFQRHLIEKHYICVVYGIPKKKSEKLESYLFKDSKKSMVYISDAKQKGYQKIITSYSVIKSNPQKNISLLDVTLETGKTHQIRAHLAHIGYPILGDGKYGLNKINKKFNQKTQCLASLSLTFNFNYANKLSYLNNTTIKQDYHFFNLL